jgi:hypothetical protein
MKPFYVLLILLWFKTKATVYQSINLTRVNTIKKAYLSIQKDTLFYLRFFKNYCRWAYSILLNCCIIAFSFFIQFAQLGLVQVALSSTTKIVFF